MRARRLPLALAVLVALGAGPAQAVTAPTPRAPTPGAPGIGDPYFPRDGNGGIDVLHYDIRDTYVFGSGELRGRTRLQVRATQDLSRFDLDFLLPVRSVKVDGRRARFRQVGDHELRITPAAPLASGSRFRVSVEYAGTPGSIGSAGEHNWLADRDEVVAMNEPHMAAWWFPANDHPRDKAGFDIRITVPRHKQVVANGVLVSKRKRHRLATTHWRAVEPMATYLAFFAAGSFDVHTTTCLGVPDVFAVSRRPARGSTSPAAQVLADRTCSIVTTFSSVLGPYPFSAMGGLATGLPVGFALENQTRPTYPAPAAMDTGLLAHELAHQWFGDSVSVAAWRDIWLNEGFAQYLSTYYVLEAGAGRSLQTWLTDGYDSYPPSSTFWTLPIDDPGPARLFDSAVYTRGAMAVQALRHRIGDPAFWTLLRTWVSERRYGNGSVADFEALAGTVSGQDLTAFFTAWLHAPV
ncbi:MAG TPA: M1 family metallopeptidase, partial [Nocardioides sp.]|uniref:M1 family metallopeptidase n=1 Tax=Nocardioides sp. TaxID=35761 RepID=UPI002E2F3196